MLWIALVVNCVAAMFGAATAVRQTVRLHTAQGELATTRTALATEQRDRAQDRAAAAEAAASAVAAARAEEQRRVAAHQEIAHDAQNDAARARAGAAAAGAAARSLRERAAALAARCSAPAGDTAAAAGSPPAAGAGLVLADVLGRADARAGDLAEAYTAARIAGLTCERAYDALRAGE